MGGASRRIKEERRESPPDWMFAAGEMAEVIRNFGWLQTPLGRREEWSVTLRSSVNAALATALPSAILWGEILVLLYNDAFQRIVGDTPPSQFLGQSMLDGWPKSWGNQQLICNQVLQTQRPILLEDQLLRLNRDGATAPEDAYFSISYSPIVSETGVTSGVQVTMVDTTRSKRAEQEALTKSALLKAQFDNSPDVIMVLDRHYVFKSINKTLFTHLPVTELLGKTGINFLPNPAKKQVKEKIDACFASGETQYIEHDVGENKCASVRIVPLPDPSGEILNVIAIATDITDRRSLENSLRQRNRELRAVSNCNEVLIRCDDELTLLKEICRIICDDAGYRMAWVGYRENDIAKTVRPVAWAGVEEGYLRAAKVSWADTERGQGPTGRSIRTGKTIIVNDYAADPTVAVWRGSALERGYHSGISLPLKNATGDVFGALSIFSTGIASFVEEEIRLLEELAGDLAYGIGTIRLRKDSEKAEEELKRSEKRLALAIAATADAVWEWNLNTGSTFYSPRWYEMLGYEVEQFPMTFESWKRLCHPDDFPPALEKIQSTFTARESVGYEVEFRMRHKNGSWVWILGRGRIVERDSAGRPVLLSGTNTDITDRKIAGERLRKSEEKFFKVFMQGPAPISIATMNEGRFIDVNNAFCVKVGLPKDEIVGHTALELGLWTEGNEERNKYIDQLRKVGYLRNLELPFRMHNGEVRKFLVSGQLIELDGVQCNIVHAIDVTERKKAEDSLQESEARFASFMDNLPAAAFIKDQKGRVLFCNRYLQDLLNLHHYKYKTNFELFPKDVAERLSKDDDKALGAGPIVFEETWIDSHRNERQFETIKFPLESKNGERLLGGIAVDVSERHKLANDLRTAIAMRDEFMPVASHELRTPFAALHMQIQLLQRLTAEEGAVRDARILKVSQGALASAQSLNDLLNELLDFTRIRGGSLRLERQDVDLKAVVEESAALAEEDARRRGSASEVKAAQPIIGKWDRKRMVQVVSNLLSNAIKYGEGKPIEITLNFDQERAVARLSIRDHGMGISKEMQGKIFERFQRAVKDTSITGLGLGLYVSRQIIEAHEGTIAVESEAGEGALFIVELPISPRKVEQDG